LKMRIRISKCVALLSVLFLVNGTVTPAETVIIDGSTDITETTEVSDEDETVEKEESDISEEDTSGKDVETSEKVEESTEDDDTADKANSNDVKEMNVPSTKATSGTVGTVNWQLGDDGVMTLSAGTISSTATISQASTATKLVFEGKVTVSGSTRTNIFNGFSSVTSIEGISNLDTSNLTDFSEIFSGLTQLTSLDLSGWNTSNVTDMRNMLVNLPNLKELSISGWDFSNVTILNQANPNSDSDFYAALITSHTSRMFAGATALESLDASGATLPDMKIGLFSSTVVTHRVSSSQTGVGYGYRIENGTLLNPHLRKLNLNGVTTDCTKHFSLQNSFIYGLNLESCDLGNIDFSKFLAIRNNWPSDGSLFEESSVVKLSFNGSTLHAAQGTIVFSGLSKSKSGIKELDLSNLDTSNVRDMSSMFSGMSGLTNIDVSSFNTSNVTNMSSMFSGMSGLTNIDVSSFNTSNVTDMNSMFADVNSYSTSALTSLDLSSFDTNNVTDLSNMFSGLTNLEKISLGGKTILNSSVDLKEVIPELDSEGNYNTGGWNLVSESQENYFGSSADFMTNYNGSHPGTYVRTRGLLDIRANNFVIDRSTLSAQAMSEEEILQAASAQLSLVGSNMSLARDLMVKDSIVFNKDTETGAYTVTLGTSFDASLEKKIKVFVIDDDSGTIQGDTVLYSKNFLLNASERPTVDEARILKLGEVKAYELSSGNEVELVPLDADKIKALQQSTALDTFDFELETVKTRVKRTLTVGIRPGDSMINVTIPMSIFYDVTDESGEVKSNTYDIINNSEDVSLKVGFSTNSSGSDFTGDSNVTFLPTLPNSQTPDGTESIHLLFNTKKGSNATQVALTEQGNAQWSETLSKKGESGNKVSVWLSGLFNGHVPTLEEGNRKQESNLILHFEAEDD
jgi:surface protein